MATYEYKIDTSSTDMDNIEDIIDTPPTGTTFVYTPVVHTGGTGIAVGDGYPLCQWVFDFLSWNDWVTMLAFLGSDASISLYINTRRPDNTYATYSAVMHRPIIPDEATPTMGGWTNITFRFTHLEAV